MINFKGFKTKEEAKQFIKTNKRGLLCGKDGPHKQDWKDCVTFGGLDKEQYPFAVQWRESQF